MKVSAGTVLHPNADFPNSQVVHDFTNGAKALRRHFGTDLRIERILDTQLAFEAVLGDSSADLDSVLFVFALGRKSVDANAYRCVYVVCYDRGRAFFMK